MDAFPCLPACCCHFPLDFTFFLCLQFSMYVVMVVDEWKSGEDFRQIWSALGVLKQCSPLFAFAFTVFAQMPSCSHCEGTPIAYVITRSETASTTKAWLQAMLTGSPKTCLILCHPVCSWTMQMHVSMRAGELKNVHVGKGLRLYLMNVMVQEDGRLGLRTSWHKVFSATWLHACKRD